ncbi:MAG: hypothetical protein RL660_1664 [Bacteroidota bacterium]|jgi:hypothetical protein
MNKNNEMYLGMMLKVMNFSNKNGSKLATIADLPPLLSDHSALVTEIINADIEASLDLRGVTMDKAKKRKIVEQEALKISNALSSYAASTGNDTLRKNADFNTSSWYSMSEEELLTNSKTMLSIATPLLSNLAPVGIVAADLQALSDSYDALLLCVNDPSLAADKRKRHREIVDNLLAQALEKLDGQIDVHMRLFESSDPVFYKLYLDARALDVNGSQTPPQVDVEVLEGKVITLHRLPRYSPDTLVIVQNLSDTANVAISLSMADAQIGTQELLIPAGETRQRLISNLGGVGTYIVGNNISAVPARVKVWIEG